MAACPRPSLLTRSYYHLSLVSPDMSILLMSTWSHTCPTSIVVAQREGNLLTARRTNSSIDYLRTLDLKPHAHFHENEVNFFRQALLHAWEVRFIAHQQQQQPIPYRLHLPHTNVAVRVERDRTLFFF